MLANEKGVEARVHQAMDIFGAEDAAFAHLQDVGGNVFGERDGSIERDLERIQITVVDADQAGAGTQSPLELFGGVGFDQRGHAVFGGQFAKAAERVVIEDCDDQQDRVCPHGRRFKDGVIGQGEIFS